MFYILMQHRLVVIVSAIVYTAQTIRCYQLAALTIPNYEGAVFILIW
jgi:hypothetical protein